ncbi:MAG: hypothetical protein KGJ07_03665 [Patescibacteria group bacterium]|nr:hypothetical protein [Patescibacteria group bacterium]
MATKTTRSAKPEKRNNTLNMADKTEIDFDFKKIDELKKEFEEAEAAEPPAPAPSAPEPDPVPPPEPKPKKPEEPVEDEAKPLTAEPIKRFFTDEMLAEMMINVLDSILAGFHTWAYNYMYRGTRMVAFDDLRLNDDEIEMLMPLGEAGAHELLKVLPDWALGIIWMESIYIGKIKQHSIVILKKGEL